VGDEGFLRTILDAPEDDAPRLVYADWLEEHGQPERAEFIRIECEQTTIRSDPVVAPNRWDSPRFWELEERRKQLYDRYAAQWFAPLFRVIRGGEMSTRRGFPWHVALAARRFIELGEAIFRAAPTVEDVFLDRLGRNMPDLARCPALGSVRWLTFFETPFRTREAEQFAASPYLGNLGALEIGFTDTQIGPRGAAALAGARALRRLERLDVHNHAVYDEGAEALFGSERLATLTSLHLGNNGLTDEAALALSEADHLKLTSLDLMSNHLTGRGVAALAGAAHLAGVERLSLQLNPLGHAGAVRLVEAHFAGRLRELSLTGCGLDDQAVALVFGAALPALTGLSVGWNAVGERSARALKGNASAVRLETLSVINCGIGPDVAGLLGAASLPGLRELRAGRNPLGPDGVRALLAGSLVRPVHHLELEPAELGDAGAEALAASPAVANVQWLELRDNRITDRGAVALAESPHLAAVQSLDLSNNPIRSKGRLALTRRFGDRVTV
jgi:uncharacterized protein (TIGR02996 family)